MRKTTILSNALIALVVTWLAPPSLPAEITQVLGAQFENPDTPRGIATDSAGNVYVSSSSSGSVLKITPAGTISTAIGFLGDEAGRTLRAPYRIATDVFGNLYVTGGTSDNVFKVTPSGSITEILDASGDGAGNMVDFPQGIATDAAGNVYVVCRSSDNVFKIAPGGDVELLLDENGNGAGTGFVGSYGNVAVDALGNVFVAASSEHVVFKISPAGTVTIVIDSAGDGIGNTLTAPTGVAVDGSENVYVSGDGSSNAFKITPAGVITEIIDDTGDGLGNALAGARDIAVDATGNVFVAARSDNAFKITPGGVITQIIDAGAPGMFGGLEETTGIATDSTGNAFVIGRLSDNAFKITPAGVVTEIVNLLSNGAGVEYPRDPEALAVDSSDNLFVLDRSFADRVYKRTPAGVTSIVIDGTGDGTGNLLDEARAITADTAGNLFVSGINSDNAFKVTPAGVITEIIDATGDGAGNILDGAGKIETDTAGNVYVVGASSDNAFMITPAGVISEIIDDSGDGAGNLLSAPVSVAVDGSGNVYVAGNDSTNAFKITPGGVITQIIDGNGDGQGNLLQNPGDIVVDAVGTVYVLDVEKQFQCCTKSSIFKIAPTGEVTTHMSDLAIDGARPSDLAIDSEDNLFVSWGVGDTAFKVTPNAGVVEIIDVTVGNTSRALSNASGVAVNDSGAVYVSGTHSENVFKITFEDAACGATPDPSCFAAPQGQLKYDEKKAGREKMKLKVSGVLDIGAETLNRDDFGNPVTGDTNVAVCLYDDADSLVLEGFIEAGGLCAGRECWRQTANSHGYKDKNNASDGISKLKHLGLLFKGSRIQVQGKNNAAKGQMSLPTGVAAALLGNVAPKIQIVSSNNICFVSTMTAVKKDDGIRYQARAK